MSPALSSDPTPYRDNPIRAIVPCAIAFDLERMQKVVANRGFVVNPKTPGVESVGALERG